MDLSSMSDRDLQAIAGQSGLAAISNGILGQESGHNPNIGSSIDGAIGQAQIMPGTFAQYAKPGEDINNPNDNLAVHQRIIQDLSQKAGGDPARIAVGYFSGPGNIAPPDSPTPWKNDRADGNGKTVSSYVSDVLGRVGNAVVPSANAATMPQDLSSMSDEQLAQIAGGQTDPSGMGAQPWSALHVMSQPLPDVGQPAAQNQQGGLSGLMQMLADKPIDDNDPSYQPGALSLLGVPNALRSLGRGALGMMQDISGEGQPVGSNLNPDELGALAVMSPKSVASNVGRNAAIAETPKTSPAPEAAPNAVPKTSEDMGALANASYKAADEAGGTITPAGTNKVVAVAEKAMPQTKAGSLVFGNNEATKLAEKFKALKDKPLSLAEGQELDEGLSDAIDGLSPLGKPSKQAVKLMKIQNALRDIMHSPAAEDISGGQAGFDALQQGRVYWTQMMKMRDLERIEQNAALTDQAATSIRSGVRAILKNPAKRKFYSPDEIAMLKKAASAGVLGEVLRGVGSRLAQYAAGGAGFAVGGPISGMAAGAAAHFVSGAARNAAQVLQESKLRNAVGTVAKNTTPKARK